MSVLSKHDRLNKWISEVADMCRPDSVYLCDGSKEEYDRLMAGMVATGMATPLKNRPNSFLFRSHPSDVARVEDRTYISTSDKNEAGPTNNWIDPAELKEIMKSLYQGCMKGRTMYVSPFSMGPIGIPLIKRIIRSVRVMDAEALARSIMPMRSGAEIEQAVRQWMEERLDFFSW